MQPTIDHLKTASNHARHIASQLKQLTLRALAGYEPTVQQLEHIDAILARLHTTTNQLTTAADARMAHELRLLVHHDRDPSKF